MKSSYKRLGNYIEPVDEFNDGMLISETNLQGINNIKEFQNSHTNTIDVDLSKYRIVRTNHFAFNRATTRNGDKISIALRKGPHCIVSPSYRVFKTKDEKTLNSEYLMMWFRRPEFDRYARFKSHGSAHEFFDLDEMNEVMLPLLPISSQQALVSEYNTIQNRINLNKTIIQKIEETALSVFKEWFLDFEFPDNAGKPYKSNGGEMKESGLGEIPMAWEVVSIKQFCKHMRSGGTPSRDTPEYWEDKDIPWIKTGEVSNRVITNSEEFISLKGSQFSSAKKLPMNTVLIAMYGEGKTKGQAGYLRFEAATNQACCAMICEEEVMSTLLYYFLRHNQAEIANLANGGAQPNLSKELIENIKIIRPAKEVLSKHPLVKFINYSECLEIENQKLRELRSLLLAKMASA